MSKINSRIEELKWLLSIMADLKHHYPDHNKIVLGEFINTTKYKIELLEKQLCQKINL